MIAPPFDIGEPDAVAGGERVEARRGQRLMQEVRGIGVEHGAGGRMHVRGLELAAQRRGVDIAFGAGVLGRRQLVHGVTAHQGSEYVLVLVKLFIASCTPSL